MGQEIIRKDKGYICTITINRPEKKNALNVEALFNLGNTIKQIEREDKIRVLVIRGAGRKAFSSGMDFSCGSEKYGRAIEGLELCVNSLINYPQPIISMVFGPAIGAGLDISVISDFRIAADNAQFGAPLVKLGRTYYYTAIERLTRLIGISASKELLLTGRLVDSARAEEIGLVNQVVSSDILESVTDSLANEIAENTAPIAVGVTKLTIKKLFQESQLDPSLEKELAYLADKANRSHDAKEGIKAALEKRNPQFTGT